MREGSRILHLLGFLLVVAFAGLASCCRLRLRELLETEETVGQVAFSGRQEDWLRLAAVSEAQVHFGRGPGLQNILRGRRVQVQCRCAVLLLRFLLLQVPVHFISPSFDLLVTIRKAEFGLLAFLRIKLVQQLQIVLFMSVQATIDGVRAPLFMPPLFADVDLPVQVFAVDHR